LVNTGLTKTIPETQISGLWNRTLMPDLETTRSGKIRHIGAALTGRIFEKKERAGSTVHNCERNKVKE